MNHTKSTVTEKRVEHSCETSGIKIGGLVNDVHHLVNAHFQLKVA